MNQYLQPLGANKTGFNLMIFISVLVKNLLQYDAIHGFSVWLRTDSDPADINRFESQTVKEIINNPRLF